MPEALRDGLGLGEGCWAAGDGDAEGDAAGAEGVGVPAAP
jgi:hypothetical protein